MVRVGTDDQDDNIAGRDLGSRAAIRRVVAAGVKLHREVSALPESARHRIGLTDTAAELDSLSQIISRAHWASIADLLQHHEDDFAYAVIDHARLPDVAGTAEVQLVTNNCAISEKFWRAVWPAAQVERRGTYLLITPSLGPTLRFSEATVSTAITTVDLRVTTDAACADRLRAAGFEVAHDGTQAIDVNGTDSTIHLMQPMSGRGTRQDL